MKLDSEQVCSHGSAGHKSQRKTIECHEKIWESVGFKNIKGSLEEKQMESTQRVDDLANGSEKAVGEIVASMPPNHSPMTTDSFDDPVFYVDKSFMERQLSELIVCYKDNTYQIVKDICIDEGVPSQDKFLFDRDLTENENVDLVVSVPFVPKSSSAKENLDLRQRIPDEFEFLEGLGSRVSASDFGTRGSQPTGVEGLERNEKIVTYAPQKTSMIGDSLMQDSSANLSCFKSYRNSTEESKQQPIQIPREKAQFETVSAYKACPIYDKGAVPTSPPIVSRGEESDHSSEDVTFITTSQNSAANDSVHGSHKIDMASPALIPATKESENVCEEADSAGASTSEAKEVDNAGKETKPESDAFDRAFETLPGISADELSSAPPPSCGQSCLQNADEESLETRPILSHPRDSPGATSFSTSGPLSGLITHSGSIAYSGSLSIRSDSSTTSTRSFAFPILQTEWNSSPVRMAKAERKHFRRRKKWGCKLFCCRF